MLFAITSFLLIVFILSYLILKFIYRIIFKSKKRISKFLVFLGGIGLIIFYYTPYSYYLEPSYWQLRNICKLDPEIYQANGGKLDEEYYNKVLKYFDTSWDYVQNNSYFNDYGDYLCKFEKHDDKISFTFFIVFKDEKATKDNIDHVWSVAQWFKGRPLPDGNEGTGFYFSSFPLGCSNFEKD